MMEELKLVCRAKSFFSSDRIVEGSGHLAELNFGWFGEHGRIVADDVAYEVRKGGMFSGHWTLVRAGAVIASAQKSSAFSNTFEIDVDGRTLRLQSASMFGSAFHLQERGSIVAQLKLNFWSTRRTVSADTGLGFPAIAFCVWLIETMRRREHAATDAA